MNRIGFINLESGEQRVNADPESAVRIRLWAEQQKLSSVVWTDLTSNFDENGRGPFSVEAAANYLRLSLDAEGARKAKEYIERAPSDVQTPLRQHLQQTDWWKTYGTT